MSSSNKYYFFNKVVMTSIWQWVDTHQKRNDGNVPEVLLKMKTKGYNMKVINGFSDDEVKKLKSIETDPVFMGIKATKISYLVHALVVLKLWVEKIPKKDRPVLNISDKKLIKGKAEYAVHMLLAKKLKPELYADEKKIIDETEDAAKKWFQYFYDQLVEE